MQATLFEIDTPPAKKPKKPRPIKDKPQRVMPFGVQNPETNDEWQEAIDAAYFMRMMRAAVKYGMLDWESMKVVRGRVEEIEQAATDRGFSPSVDDARYMADEMAGFLATQQQNSIREQDAKTKHS